MIIGSRTVLKIVGRETGLWVRVPLSPQDFYNIVKILQVLIILYHSSLKQIAP